MKAFADHFRLSQMSVVLLILTVTACDNTPDTLEHEMTAIRGSYSGTITFVMPEEAGSLNRCDANASDGEHPGSTLSLADEATGKFSVLGPVTIVGSGCHDFDRERFAQGEMTMTTASGDVLMTEYHGSVRVTAGPVGVGRAEHQVLGGTGRFAQAEGIFVCEFRFASAKAPSSRSWEPATAT